MEAVRTSETSVDNHFTRQYISEDIPEDIPDDGGSTHLWNVGLQSFYKAVHPRRQFWTSYSPPWELEISHGLELLLGAVRVYEQGVARPRIPSGSACCSLLSDLFESLQLLFLRQVGGFCSKAGKNFFSSFFLSPLLHSFLTMRVSTFVCCYRCEEEGGATENFFWKWLFSFF
jgi:hypothetical protein